MTISCPSCGAENPDRARFCMECAAALQAAPSERPTQERRVVSILFVDLVGFTERSDAADPEDVRRTLVPYHARVKADLERYGGTLDKFIGDAVMGVFGAPVAHEDDPARAVRAALRILGSVDELRRVDPGIAVRVAVNTGEAIVSFGTGPQVGEAVAGDVVNTASRMQALAPRDGIVIGEATERAIRGRFELEEMEPALVKGKSAPIRVWRVMDERTSGEEPAAASAFVGREEQLAQLGDLLDRSIEGPRVQVATLVGEPGLGKSRLVGEFLKDVPESWIGRCVPYGEDIALRPVADILRALAGVDVADDPSDAERKLTSLVADVATSDADREWLLATLEPILGFGGAPADASATRRETAAAFVRVLSARGAEPLVLVIEDLQWADDVLRGLLGDAVEELEGRAVLLLCTARPELADREGWWASDGATLIELPRLTDAEADHLISSLLSQELAVANGVREALLEQAGGNPLYAREFANLMADRLHSLDAADGPASVPENVHAMIAARLDALPIGLRSVVSDASVVGTEFWPGTLAEIGGALEADVAARVQDLARRGFLEALGDSPFPRQPQFGFTHALIREVAYGRIPRANRARKHLAAGRWIERESGDRVDERSEALARHYSAAAELAAAAGASEEAGAARSPAARWLVAAGERAAVVDMPGAFPIFERALGFADPGTAERANALQWYGLSGRRSGKLAAAEVLASFEEALEIERSRADPEGVGRALVRVGSQLGAMGEPARSRAALTEAVSVLEAGPAGRDLARAWAFRAEEEMYAGRVEESRDLADRALGLSTDPETDDVAVMALHIRGDARLSLRDVGGFDDLHEAFRRSESRGNAADTVTSLNYLAEWTWPIEGPRAGMPYVQEALDIAERRGVLSQGIWTRASALWQLYELGEWDRTLQWEREILELGPDRVDDTPRLAARLVSTRIAIHRAQRSAAMSSDEIMGTARPLEELQVLAPALVVAAQVAVADGDASAASELLREFRETTKGVAALYREAQLAEAARALAAIEEQVILEDLIDDSEGWTLRDRLNVETARAHLAEMQGRLSDAAAMFEDLVKEWRAYGAPFEEAHASLGLRRCGGDADDARVREVFASLGVGAQ